MASRVMVFEYTNLLITTALIAAQCTAHVVANNGIQAQQQGTNEGEHCVGETFRPRCAGGKNDVIVMLSARYGRMSFGRCLEENPVFATLIGDPQFLGCSADVKTILDQRCSGLPECEVRINNQNFDDIRPCHSGLQMHLEATYTCVQVAAESRHCTIGLSAEPQHIVGGGSPQLIQSDAVRCGVDSQPWSVEALAGQRIAVSMIDYGNHGHSATSTVWQFTGLVDKSSTSKCSLIYGYVIDRQARRNVSVCREHVSQQADNSAQIYVSRSNQLQVVIKPDVDHKFIVRFEAVGCSDLTPPSDDAWLKRVDDQITVGCYMTRQSWQLNCVNGVWAGTVGVCSTYGDREKAVEQETETRVEHDHSTTAEAVALAAVASAGGAVCCLIICIGIVCLRRQKRQRMKEHAERNYTVDVNYSEHKNTTFT